MKEQSSHTYNLQDQIIAGLVDGHAKFREDLWERLEGGGGRTRVIENGAVLKKVECFCGAW
jgi:coproporphyrinogen III oxidase